MLGGRLDLRALAKSAMGSCGPLTRETSELVRGAQRALLAGEPVSMERLGRLTRLTPPEITAALHEIPGLARFDGWGRLVGLLGVSVQPSPHRLTAGGTAAYAWCAWDTLFIPRVIGADIEAASHCPVTGTPVDVRVGSGGVSAASPGEVMVSFLVTHRPAGDCGLGGVCCSHMHFLSNTDAARRWLSSQPAGLVLTLEEAWQVGRLFVDALLAPPEAPMIAASEALVLK
jgi:alkylmercury lyase